jgi:hypothetical protein
MQENELSWSQQIPGTQIRIGVGSQIKIES